MGGEFASALHEFGGGESLRACDVEFGDGNFLASKPRFGGRRRYRPSELLLDPGLAPLNESPRFALRTAARNRGDDAAGAFHVEYVAAGFGIAAVNDRQFGAVDSKKSEVHGIQMSSSVSPAIFIWLFSKPIFRGWLPWTGTTIRSRCPDFTRM